MKIKKKVASSVIILLLCVYLCGCTGRVQLTGITWQENEDGSYTFTNNDGTKDSIYAWYVLDENGEAIFKTGYSESPEFTYDLEDNRDLIIKGFIRTGTEEEYDQTSLKVNAEDVIGRIEYAIVSIDRPENIFPIYKELIFKLGSDYTLPVESVLAQDGSKWNVDLTIPVDWSCPGITNRSFGRYINGFLFLDETYSVYCDTQDVVYANVIKDYIMDWIRQNVEYDVDNEWPWHDDTTAYRVLRMTFLYYEFKELYSKEEQELVEKSLRYQAELLSTEEFYTEKHNHGMHQDEALLLYALLLGDNDVKEDYISIALSRLGEYFDYVYTDDGIHKEHSPFYARDVLLDAFFLQEITGDISPEFSSHLGHYIDEGQEYLIQLIKPDGMWPSLGDSQGASGIVAIQDMLKDNAECRWLISGGLDGSMPENEYVFQQGGYAIFRSSWEDEKTEATWMMLVAATFSSAHKHGDDLEVLLYHKGDLFVEAGKRNYNYLDEMTSWAYSGYGHNVLLVNGEAYPVKIGANGFQSIYPEALQTGITKYDLSGDILSVTGKEYRFDNVEQERTLTYDKTNDIVTISDVLDAQESFDGTLLYHIAEGIEVEENSDGWNLYRDKELVAVISVVGDVDYEISTIIGEEGEYPYCTWIFNGSEEPAYGSLLMIDISGKKGKTKIDTIVELK